MVLDVCQWHWHPGGWIKKRPKKKNPLLPHFLWWLRLPSLRVDFWDCLAPSKKIPNFNSKYIFKWWISQCHVVFRKVTVRPWKPWWLENDPSFPFGFGPIFKDICWWTSRDYVFCPKLLPKPEFKGIPLQSPAFVRKFLHLSLYICPDLIPPAKDRWLASPMYW